MTTIRNYPHNVLSIQWRDSKKMSFGQIHVHINIHSCKEQIPKLHLLFWNKLTSSNKDIQNDNIRFDLEKFRSKPTTPKQTDACAPKLTGLILCRYSPSNYSCSEFKSTVMSCHILQSNLCTLWLLYWFFYDVFSPSCGVYFSFQCFFKKQNPLKSMVYVLTSFNICGVLYLFIAAW